MEFLGRVSVEDELKEGTEASGVELAEEAGSWACGRRPADPTGSDYLEHMAYTEQE